MLLTVLVQLHGGNKCIPYKKKYTIVFLETGRELIICEFIPSRLIYW